MRFIQASSTVPSAFMCWNQVTGMRTELKLFCFKKSTIGLVVGSCPQAFSKSVTELLFMFIHMATASVQLPKLVPMPMFFTAFTALSSM